MKTTIHVNQPNIKANENGDGLPVLTVRTGDEDRLGDSAVIVAPDGTEVARVVYRPADPLPGGARCWIETDLEVRVK